MELGLIVSSDADKGECVAHQHSLNALVEGRRAAQGGQHVHFEDPRLHIRVDHDVKPVDFEAVHSVGRILLQVGHDVRLDRDQRLNDQVFELGEDVAEIVTLFVECLPQLLEVPLRTVRTRVVFVITPCSFLLVRILDKLAVFLVNREVGQVNILLGELAGVVAVFLSGEPYEAVVVDVGLQGAEARHEDVHSQIVLQPINEMRVGDVLAGEDTLTFVNLRVALDNLDSTATTCRDWLQDPEIARVLLSFRLKFLIVFRKQVAHGCKYKFGRVLNPESVHVAPQKVLPAELGRPREVVRLLILVQPLNVFCCDVACPLHVEICIDTFDHVEAGILASVDDCVVDVGRIRDLKRHKQVVHLVSFILANAVSRPIHVDIARVGEEGSGRSPSEDRFEEDDLIGVRLEHTVREAGLFTLDKNLVQRIVLDEI